MAAEPWVIWHPQSVMDGLQGTARQRQEALYSQGFVYLVPSWDNIRMARWRGGPGRPRSPGGRPASSRHFSAGPPAGALDDLSCAKILVDCRQLLTGRRVAGIPAGLDDGEVRWLLTRETRARVTRARETRTRETRAR